MTADVVFKPQSRQEQFLSSPADIVIYGGAAGGGKTYATLLEPLRHIDNSEFGAVIFRRTVPEIIKQGAMWDESMSIYPHFNSHPNRNQHQHVFPSGAKITFDSLQYEDTVYNWKGAQVPLIMFDQLESFTEFQFFYMITRNRSTCGVAPYIRATCNPEPGWLADFLDWWIAEDGYADLDRVGKIRWFVRANGDEIVWRDTYEELEAEYPELMPAKSVTFIVSTIYDNEKLLQKDPGYLGNLKAQDLVSKERLLGHPQRGGNWKIRPSAGLLFNKDWFQEIRADEVPEGGITVRFWDLAATEEKFSKKIKKSKGNPLKGPDYTASVKMKKVGTTYYILHATNERLSPTAADRRMKELAELDGPWVAQRWEMESGASGKRDSSHISAQLDGFDSGGIRPQGDKITRAKPFAAQAFNDHVKIVKGNFTKMYLEHMHAQPEWPHDDLMDASSGAHKYLANPPKKPQNKPG